MVSKKKTANKQNERNSQGLLENVEYFYKEDGSIDWRKMVKNDYLVPNKQRTSESDVSKLDDSKILILLAGIKELAQIRGFKSVKYTVSHADMEYVCVTCGITWIGNYETGGEEVYFESMADAGTHNTESFGQSFLATTAENRAFVRAVRNFLKINLVGNEEMGPKKIASSGNSYQNFSSNKFSAVNYLETTLRENNISFNYVKERMISDGVSGAEDWQTVNDIPSIVAYDIIEKIQKRKTVKR